MSEASENTHGSHEGAEWTEIDRHDSEKEICRKEERRKRRGKRKKWVKARKKKKFGGLTRTDQMKSRASLGCFRILPYPVGAVTASQLCYYYYI